MQTTRNGTKTVVFSPKPNHRQVPVQHHEMYVVACMSIQFYDESI